MRLQRGEISRSFPERHWREADGGTELAGEGGLITISAAEGDFHDGKFAGGEELGGMADAGFADELGGGELENAAHPSFELSGGKPGDGGEIRGAQFLIEVPLDMRDDPAHARKFDILRTGRGKIAGDQGETYHFSSGIVERHFRRQIPAERAIRIRDQLQIEQPLAEPRRGYSIEKIHTRRHFVRRLMLFAHCSVKTRVLFYKDERERDREPNFQSIRPSQR